MRSYSMYMRVIKTGKEKSNLFIHPMMLSGEGLKTCITDDMGEEYCDLLSDLPAHGDVVGQKYISAKDSEAYARMLSEYMEGAIC